MISSVFFLNFSSCLGGTVSGYPIGTTVSTKCVSGTPSILPTLSLSMLTQHVPIPSSHAASIIFWTAMAAAYLGSPMLSIHENFAFMGGTRTAIAMGALA